ncbi:hypothetical protein AB2B38_000105 [Balneola sp. MJW-20]|uniref:hypothetical protein n=1 Tax=Gracilimonas aurantiaca TaxID=3234185 RepID=UPI0034678FC1
MDYLNSIKEYLLGLSSTYGVDPFIFAGIYVGAIPFFLFSMGWIVKNYRQKKPLILPVLSTVFFFISSYLYLIVAGENVPLWVYGLVLVMVSTGAVSAWKKIQGKIQDEVSE